MAVIGRNHFVGDHPANGANTTENFFLDADEEAIFALVRGHETKPGTIFRAKAVFDVENFNAGTLALRLRAGSPTGDVFATVSWTPQLGEDAVLEGEIAFESVGASGGGAGGSEFHAEGQGWGTGEGVTRTILQDRTTVETRENWGIYPSAQWGTGHADNDVVLKFFRVWQVDANEQT
jgi:hypothetical protein